MRLCHAALGVQWVCGQAHMYRTSLLNPCVVSCRLHVEAAGESGKVASEMLEVTMTSKADVSSATLSVKHLESSTEKQKTQLQFPNKLSKPMKLDQRSQLKVHRMIYLPGSSNLCSQ